MNAWKHVLFWVCICSFMWGGCASMLSYPTETDAKRAAKEWPGTTTNDLVNDRALYVSKCSGCHMLYRPEVRSGEQWRRDLDEMGGRANLSETDSAKILRYLTTMAGQTLSKAPRS